MTLNDSEFESKFNFIFIESITDLKLRNFLLNLKNKIQKL